MKLKDKKIEIMEPITKTDWDGFAKTIYETFKGYYSKFIKLNAVSFDIV